jgi:hypothetical protein
MKLLIPGLFLILALNVHAEKIYRSLDEKGNVTYSSEPPSSSVEVKKVDVAPPPSDAQRILTEQQHRQIQEKSDSLRDMRHSAQQQERKSQRPVEEEEAIVERKSTINDPGRANQQPKPSHPIVKPQPATPVNLPASSN